MPYEIAVACDVALRPSIRPADDTLGNIEIDPAAIEAVVTDLAPPCEPDETRKLLFIASHYDSLQNQGNKDARTVGLYTPARLAKHGTPTISVVVAGDPLDGIDTNLPVFNEVMEAHLFGNASEEDTARAVKAIPRLVNPLTDSREIQNTSLHELSHYADGLIPSRRREENDYFSRLRIRAAMTSLTAFALGHTSLTYIESSLDIPADPKVISYGMLALLAVSAFTAAKKLGPDSYTVYRNSPGEIRARELEATPHTYPQIVTIR